MIPLSAYDPVRHPQIADCVRSIVEVDQFDDWINDPVYYLDIKQSDAGIAKGIQAAFAAGAFDGECGTVIDLPRGPKPSIKAGYLPMLARVLNYVFCAGAIKGTNASTSRDKVYGFRYIPDSVPLFSTPNAELAQLALNLAELVRVEDVNIVDARGYLNSITPDRLQRALEQAGVSGAEISAIYGLSSIGSDGTGVLSGDDSHAALYDLFLWPVDRELTERRHNFFRYRDDYFVPSNAAIGVIIEAGRKIGITFIRKSGISGYDLDEKRSTRLTLGDGTAVRGWLNCVAECTDRAEADFEIRQRSLKRCLEIRPNEEADAVVLVPCLRRINELRAKDVLRLPGDPLVSADLRKLQTELRDARPALVGLAGGWRRSPGAAWTSCWAVQVLSDLGTLTQQETAMVSELAAATSVHGFARHAALVALARSAPPEAAMPVFRSFVDASGNSRSSRYFSARALALAHHYLTLRKVRDVTLPEAVVAGGDGLATFLAKARS